MTDFKYVKGKDASLRKIGDSFAIRNFITNEDSENISVAVSEMKNGEKVTKNVKSDRIYYFLEANAEFEFNGKVIVAEKDSTLYVPKNTKYKMSGSYKAILINSPSFNVSDEKHFE